MLAKRSGADEAINSKSVTASTEKAPSTIVISGANAAYEAAVGLTATHGAVVAVGLPAEDLKVNRELLIPLPHSETSFTPDALYGQMRAS